jgi:hypothetical protein
VTPRPDWFSIILDAPDPATAWGQIFDSLFELAKTEPSPFELHHATVVPDRILAESAWELWQAYNQHARKTANELKAWWNQPHSAGRAVLILDALSLREVPALLGAASTRGITPARAIATGAELPSETVPFAQALGLTSRSALENSNPPGKFALASDDLFTDVLDMPFEDCADIIPPKRDLVIWHKFQDDRLHDSKDPHQLQKLAESQLQSQGFWKLVQALRHGRRLVITSDHGYAVAKNFSSEIGDKDQIETLRGLFGASRLKQTTDEPEGIFMPPVTQREGQHLVVIGQRKWKVQGGFPALCHGGASLLEVAVPFLEWGGIDG